MLRVRWRRSRASLEPDAGGGRIAGSSPIPIVETLIAGLAGTVMMTVLMTIIHRSGWANADMIRALGSLATRSTEHAVRAGVFIHLAAGLSFAFGYAILLSLFLKEPGFAMAFVGAIMGLVHGIVVAFLLVAVVSEKHPVEKFRKAGLEVAIAHVVGHVGYGFGVGLMVALWRIRWDVGI